MRVRKDRRRTVVNERIFIILIAITILTMVITVLLPFEIVKRKITRTEGRRWVQVQNEKRSCLFLVGNSGPRCERDWVSKSNERGVTISSGTQA